jgi:hypothetical protein
MGRWGPFIGVVCVIAAFGLPAGAWAASSPGPIPPACNAEFQFPPPGFYPSGGCLVQGNGGLTIEPKVVHVGQDLTATIPTPPAADRNATWDWSNFVAVVGFGSKRLSGCGPNQLTCTVQASSEGKSNVWETYMHGVNENPVGCCGGLSVSSDYFIINNDLFELSGEVRFSEGTPQSEKPAPGVEVRAGTHTATTDAAGHYVLVLRKGTYDVSVVGRPAEPASRSLVLHHNVTRVTFLTGCFGRPRFGLTHKREGRAR